MTPEQIIEISRLASVWATARVRKAAVAHGVGGPYETARRVNDNERAANAAFHEYLRSFLSDEGEAGRGSGT